MALWIEVEDADTYFTKRLYADKWTAADDTKKDAALTTAQAILETSPAFAFDSTALATPTQAMKDAMCEQALYLLTDKGIDRRALLQSQGVVQAGMMKETYGGVEPSTPIAPRARDLLKTYATGGASSFPVER